MMTVKSKGDDDENSTDDDDDEDLNLANIEDTREYMPVDVEGLGKDSKNESFNNVSEQLISQNIYLYHLIIIC